MDIATIDFESYWDTDYSLSRLSPLEYVMGDRFELQSCSIKINNYPTDVFFGEDEIRRVLHKLDWTNKAALGHNMSGFDAYIMAYRLGIKPKMWMCTLAMARPVHAKTCGLGLGKLVEHYGLGVKDNTVLMQTKGRRLADFTADEMDRMREYNKEDTELCWRLFHKLKPHYNAAELWQIDALTRMRTEPAFVLDVPMLETAASVVRARKHAALLDLAKLLQLEGVQWGDEKAVAEQVRAELASAPKFGALLEQQGVEVPMKDSPTNPDKQIPALSKTDQAFLDLQDHPNEIVAMAALTRLDVKSTLLETRIQKFLTAGRMTNGKLPVPLRYCGADTTGRDSGEEYNCQNLPAIRLKTSPADALRMSMRAPKGMKVIVADQSGIEMRVNHFLWKVEDSMALYRADAEADLYRASGAKTHGITAEEVTKAQRHIEKIKALGLGFGAGPAAFQRVAKTMGGLDITLKESEGYVAGWRSEYHAIVSGWKACHAMLPVIRDGNEGAIDDWGLLTTCHEGIRLPSGRLIRYPDLRQEFDEKSGKKEWVYAHGRHKARIYAGKITENCVQALARDSIFDCAIDYYKLTRLRPALRVHDELVYVVPEGEAVELLEILQNTMRKPPKWWPELVVWSEGDVGDTYGSAK
jgi:hypothetical protein